MEDNHVVVFCQFLLVTKIFERSDVPMVLEKLHSVSGSMAQAVVKTSKHMAFINAVAKSRNNSLIFCAFPQSDLVLE